jgi:hypothetical protein
VRHRKRLLLIGACVSMGLIVAWGLLKQREDETLERTRQELVKQYAYIKIAIPSRCMDECREAESEFWFSLNKKQQRAVMGLSSLVRSRRNARRVECIKEMLALLTPGMLITLAEHAETQEDMFRQTPDLFAKIEAYKERSTGYYNWVMYDDEDTRADLSQAERFYCEVKEKITHRKGQHLLELLHDLRNAMIVYEMDSLEYDHQ